MCASGKEDNCGTSNLCSAKCYGKENTVGKIVEIDQL